MQIGEDWNWWWWWSVGAIVSEGLVDVFVEDGRDGQARNEVRAVFCH